MDIEYNDDTEMTVPRLVNFVVGLGGAAFAVFTMVKMALAPTKVIRDDFAFWALLGIGVIFCTAAVDYYLRHRTISEEQQRGFPITTAETNDEA